MRLNCSLIAVGILVTLTILVTSDDQNGNFKKVVCIIHEKSFFTNYSCSSKPINRYKTVVTMIGQLSKRLDNMMLHHQMHKKFNVIYRPFLVNVTEDFCQKFVNKAKSPYLNILMNIGQKYTNLNHTCPYEGWLIIKNMELDLSSLRLLLPEGEYRYDLEPIVDIDNKPTIVFSIQAFFEIGGLWRKKN
ncbi:uncharacterized protein LOC129950159 [Eupeodes corollae]|uniref:uncharacterized protein LOC129950159 n=1 Tax=Eupeodes corollae TaxID=290404 RepID=UPI002491B651|nr:uncharacterized protein LOC129950159 [Eupeodes corollae]